MSIFFEAASTYLKNFGDKDAYNREMRKKIGERLGVQIGPEIILSMEELENEVNIYKKKYENQLTFIKKKVFDKLTNISSDDYKEKYNHLYFQLLLLKSTQSKNPQYLLSEIIHDIEERKNKITRNKYDDINFSHTRGGPFFKYIGGINDFMIKSNGYIERIPNNYPIKFNINKIVYACLQSGSEKSFTSFIRGYGWTKTLNEKSFCKDTNQMDENFFDQKPFAYEIIKYKNDKNENIERKIPIYRLLRINDNRIEISSNHFDYILVEALPQYIQKVTQEEIEAHRKANGYYSNNDAPIELDDIGLEPSTNTGGKLKKYTNKMKKRHTKKHKNNKKYKTKNRRKSHKH